MANQNDGKATATSATRTWRDRQIIALSKRRVEMPWTLGTILLNRRNDSIDVAYEITVNTIAAL